MTSYQAIHQAENDLVNHPSTQHYSTVRVIQNDAEALDIAQQLAEQFKTQSIERDAQRILPFAEIEAFSQSGLWAITVPKRYGGAEVSSLTVAKIIALLSGVDGSIGQIPQNHFYALEVLRNTGTEAQKQRLYQEVLDGARFGNALAEFKPKNASLKQTALIPVKEGYLINGEKFYCTGSLFAHRIPTLVVDAEGREYLAFVQRQSEGLSLIDNWTGFGQRVTGSGSVKFHQVFVAAEDVIPFDTAFQQPTLVGPFAQIMHAAIEVGIARAAFEETLKRVHLARPWIDSNVESAAEDPLTIYEIGRVATDIRASEALLKQAAHSIDAAKLQTNAETIAKASIDVAKVRAHSSETALKASSKLIELAGSRGSQAEDGLDRFWRNARVHTLHDAARWKYYFIGNYILNGILPPRRGTL
ncbi:SfnB family sulfur acquisition oxidoreductase [Acinetobacter ursingii]|uniref:SfnB family sulfur acquisition oxidoreductase n=1 Tax=Acinetobacter ursingii TaxID=108980 RepID=A0AA46PCR4_9GAMM|nr:SfnB family sulfur acquisition oxidoreductase [Acinetobacter ursingii]ENV76526.1 SfnB family sulfur acquisition oxidoreductase [Acinetobacter ursingii DSM 16037 = CIP 107286]MDA3579294.1 SfnB family sulfur acquisition oxidoreductase [Acinetobacter ursingii]MDH0809006.1 SfnB family sulfur acquisition oxidoreductase [Acinetobacter ursingii]MDH2019805.1 SfnB family sulfur acquisition oxidoreductase [Acinetobacter ursingii]MDH2072166.1 SfnB family sulfur acquisition oxidoreductase [Acinetobacte